MARPSRRCPHASSSTCAALSGAQLSAGKLHRPHRNESGGHFSSTSLGSTTFPMLLLIFWPSAAVTKPCPKTALGSGMPADHSMHGQITQWNQMMSLPACALQRQACARHGCARHGLTCRLYARWQAKTPCARRPGRCNPSDSLSARRTTHTCDKPRCHGAHGAIARQATHMTCFASSGTGIPQSNVVREMDRSSSGSRCKRARISLRHGSGLMKSGLLLMCSMSRSWYLARRS